MIDGQSDNGEEATLNVEMILEAPPTAGAEPIDALSSSMSGLLGDDMTVVTSASKLALVELYLKQITRDQSFDDFLREVLLATMKVVTSEAGSLLEVDHERNSLFFRSVVGTSSDRVVGFVIPMGQGVVGHVAESRRPLLVTNVAENRMHLKAIQDAVGFTARNLVAVPIVIRSRIYGVLELLNRVGEPDYTALDLELLSYACEMMAKAIEARLMIAWASNKRKKQSADGEAA